MIFKIFTLIVFIAQIIITIALLNSLVKLDKKVKFINSYINDNKSKIQDIMVLTRKVSEQILELVPIYVEKLKINFETLIFNQIKNILGLYLFNKINKKFFKLSNNKLIKKLSNCFKLIKYVV